MAITIQMNYNIGKIRKDLEAFYKKISLISYKNKAYGNELKLRGVYKDYKHLCKDKDLIGFIKQKRDKEIDKLTKRRLHYLYFALIGLYSGEKLIQFKEELSKLGLQSVRVNNKNIPLRDINYLIANEKNRRIRRKLYNLTNKNTIESNRLMIKLLEESKRLTREFGFNDDVKFYEEYKQMNLNDFDLKVTKLLNETDDMFKELLEDISRKKLNLSLNQLRAYDFGFLYRAKEFDRFFPKDKAISTIKKTLLGMGLNLSKQRNISIDIKERPKKIQGAYCCSISVPDDIRLLIKPVGGFRDYESLLHETAHAEHIAHINKNIDFEFKWIGNVAIAETFAIIFANLILDNNWLRKYIGMDEKVIKSFLKQMLFLKLGQIRNQCCSFKFDMVLCQKNPKNLREYFTKLYKDVFFIKLNYTEKLRYLYLSNDFYSVEYISAWFLDAQTRSKLKENYGEEWFENKESLTFLKKLWRQGLKPNTVELANEIGFKKLEPNYLINELFEIYNKTK